MTALLSLFVVASIFAAPPAASPSAPALCANPAAQVEQPSFVFASATAKAYCVADCGDLNGTVSCSGNVCSAMNQSQTCPSGPGYVTCDGQTTYCPACCTNGNIRNVIVGDYCSCPDGQTTPRERYQCVNGLWEYQFSFCGGPFCQGT